MTNNYKTLDGRVVAGAMYEDISRRATELVARGFGPNLVSISVGESEASRLYVRNQKRTAQKLGIGFDEREFSGDISIGELTGIIGELNADPRVTGIIIQRPVPDHLPVRTLQAKIHPLKDVEGMHPSSIGNIVYNELVMGPCTAVASVELLKKTGLELKGLEVVIIGHSEIVGKPIAFLLMSEGATVTVCHHMTRNLRVHSRSADAVFVAVGKPGLVTGDMIKPGAALIDIGINQITDEDGNSKVVGDADFDSCLETAGWITPVPGGVGPVTVAVLMRNSVIAAGLINQ
ncbi:Methenyltetrahydrofolate cyclohydrolase / Methylenetetrahydrofolate dehydrogenase (NADP+) [hydrothermal vent metagenome]|uniref:Methenyltetrahydrofolate cyclohydrolase / Methylenetetrahydrofolate dehydrogenase (NADP+) n=2 Tax=hydrothermal vent metagenome TaxID=652676 RepID=A0A3B0RC16_9ZZZZ